MTRATCAAALALAAAALPLRAQAPQRPFGTVREQADRQQRWLQERMDRHLPALMRRHGVDMWVMPMREYNEDPVFRALVAPTTFAARRRTIYVFFDRGPAQGVERLALGGTSQGGVYSAYRSTRPVTAPVAGRQAELWGDEQWALLRQVIEERNPARIAVNVSRTFAFADGLTAGEYDGMRAALGPALAAKLVTTDGLAVDFLALRTDDERAFFRDLVAFNWTLIDEMFSDRVVTPGVTRTSDLVWWYRQRLADLGLGTWFQPSVSVQRRGARPEQLGDDPVIERGDVLWCDVGITALGLNTDIQHVGYVLREGETAVPAGLVRALQRTNRLQDIVMEEIRPGRTGNEILLASRERMDAEKLLGTVYSHPIGLHGHGAGPLIGLWDLQDGVAGRGDHRVIPETWFSIELQVTSPVEEWGGQWVRIAQEEDMVIGAGGTPEWAYRRQTGFHVVR